MKSVAKRAAAWSTRSVTFPLAIRCLRVPVASLLGAPGSPRRLASPPCQVRLQGHRGTRCGCRLGGQTGGGQQVRVEEETLGTYESTRDCPHGGRQTRTATFRFRDYDAPQSTRSGDQIIGAQSKGQRGRGELHQRKSIRWACHDVRRPHDDNHTRFATKLCEPCFEEALRLSSALFLDENRFTLPIPPQPARVSQIYL
jgi:hypothetical protein